MSGRCARAVRTREPLTRVGLCFAVHPAPVPPGPAHTAATSSSEASILVHVLACVPLRHLPETPLSRAAGLGGLCVQSFPGVPPASPLTDLTGLRPGYTPWSHEEGHRMALGKAHEELIGVPCPSSALCPVASKLRRTSRSSGLDAGWCPCCPVRAPATRWKDLLSRLISSLS